MKFDPEYIKLGVELLTILGAGLAFLWRISARFSKHEEVLKNTAKTMENLVISQKRIVKDLAKIEVKIEEREKDIIKVEAAIDGTRRDIYELIKESQKSQSKIDALWATLQNIFPSQVPKRASDSKQ